MSATAISRAVRSASKIAVNAEAIGRVWAVVIVAVEIR